MGVIGGLFTKHNDFQATGNRVGMNDLSGLGYNNVSQGAGAANSNALAASNMGMGAAGAGFGQSNEADAGQAGLANQLALRAAGKAGPSIAEQQLSQSMGQVQQQGAGSMAAARGISPGTAARLIGNQQTNAAQQAAGQGAILRSQEQQAAENQLANVLSQRRQGALGQAQLGSGSAMQASQILGGQQSDANRIAAGVAQGNQQSQMDAQRINSGVAQANTNADNQAGSGLMNAAGGALSMFGLAHGGEVTEAGEVPNLAHALLASHKHLSSAHEALAHYAAGGEVHGSYDFPAMDVRTKDNKPKPQYVPHNGLDVSPTSGQTAAEPGKEGTDSEGNKKALKFAGGGLVPKSFRDNADADKVEPDADADDANETAFERHLKERDRARESNKEQDTQNTMRELSEGVQHKADGGFVNTVQAGAMPDYDKIGMVDQAKPGDAMKAGKKPAGPTMDINGTNPNMVGAGPTYDASADESAGLSMAPVSPAPMAGTPMPAPALASHGGNVPGHARVAGNSPKNDTVPTMLSPGEVVLPRTISHDPDAAAEFVQHINARKKMAQGGQVGGYGQVLAKQRELHNRLSALEAKLGRK